MKKMISLLLAGLLALSLVGCSLLAEQPDTVRFYYRRTDIAYSDDGSGVIASESRELSVRGDDLEHLLPLYFHGPLDAGLRSPFATGTSVTQLDTADDALIITLDTQPLEGLDRTIACACLAQTCFDLLEVSRVCVEMPGPDGDITSTVIQRDNVLLTDAVLSPTETTR